MWSLAISIAIFTPALSRFPLFISWIVINKIIIFIIVLRKRSATVVALTIPAAIISVPVPFSVLIPVPVAGPPSLVSGHLFLSYITALALPFLLTTSITLSWILYTIGKSISSETTSHGAENGGNETSAIFIIIIVAAGFVLAASRSLGCFTSYEAANNSAQKTGAYARCRVREVIIYHIASARNRTWRTVSWAASVIIIVIVGGRTRARAAAPDHGGVGRDRARAVLLLGRLKSHALSWRRRASVVGIIEAGCWGIGRNARRRTLLLRVWGAARVIVWREIATATGGLFIFVVVSWHFVL
jgi:hypothetical protein